MKKNRLFLLAFALWAVSVYPGVAQEPSDIRLPLDPDVRVGRLDNGMTYYIKHAENPAQRADFFIAHNVGALQEEDNQDGLAHFLEHLAFNGTKNFPKTAMLDYLSSIGLQLGPNVNAYTSRERTVYNLSNVPVVREGIVDTALLILHDWSGSIACEPEEIEAERGVIREEWRRGDNSRSRLARRTAEYEYAGSKHAKRTVLGNWDVINNFERQTLVDFYHKWYRPDMQAVIVVGDIDVDKMEQKIRKVMSTIPPAVNPAPKETYTIPDTGAPVYGLITDPENKGVGIKMIFRQPYPSPEDRLLESSLVNNIARKIFLELVCAHIRQVEKQPDAPYNRLVAVCGKLSTCKQTLQLTALPKGLELQKALTGMLIDVEQIRRYNFSPEEFNRAKAKVARDEQKNLERARRMTNTNLAGLYVAHFTDNEPYMTWEDREKATKEALEAITLKDVNDMRQEMTRPDDMMVIFSLPDSYADKAPSKEVVMRLIDSIGNADIPAPIRQKTIDKPLFTKQITPGKVVKTASAPYDATEWTLSNGAKVQWRTVHGVKGARKIGMTAVKEGGFACDDDVEALRILQSYLRSAGVKGFPYEELNELLFDREVSASVFLRLHTASIDASSSVKDLETMLQLVNLYLTEPDFSEESFSRYAERYKNTLEKEKGGLRIFRDSVNKIMYDNHVWLTPVTLQSFDRINAEKLRKLYEKVFGNVADYTFFFAGDMEAEEARPLIEKYIGSLEPAPHQKYADMQMQIIPGTKEFKFVQESRTTPKAQIQRIYHGKFKCSPDNYATLRYICQILANRYRISIREEKGGTYTIGVQQEVDVRPEGYCRIYIDFETDPKLSAMLLEEVQKGIADLAAKLPSEQEVADARLYFQRLNLERKPLQQQTFTYWLGKMQTRYFDKIDFEADNEEYLLNVSAKDINKLTRQILSQGNCFTSIYSQE